MTIEMTKKMVECETEELHLFFGNNTVAKLIELLDKHSVPADAEIDVGVDYDGCPDSILFRYQREETDAEYEARLKKEYYEQKRIQDDEIAMYKILKKKFEGETNDN